MKPYYEVGGITIYHGDSREILPSLAQEKDSVIITDPPYGIDYESGRSSPLYGAIADEWNSGVIDGDESTALRDFILDWGAGLTALIFGSWRVSKPVGTHTVLIWDKGGASGMGDLAVPWKPSWEEIYVIGKNHLTGRRDGGVIKGHHVPPRISMGRKHPMEKPVSLLRYLISKTTAPLVIDPCMGSGPTLRAAKDLGRRAIGIEIKEHYCEIAARRLDQQVLDLFGSEAA